MEAHTPVDGKQQMYLQSDGSATFASAAGQNSQATAAAAATYAAAIGGGGAGGYMEYPTHGYSTGGQSAATAYGSPYQPYSPYAAPSPMSFYAPDASPRADMMMGGMSGDPSATMSAAGAAASGFYMPMPGAGGGQVGADGSMLAFQNAFGGGYPFYDTATHGEGVAMPQGLLSSYQALSAPSGTGEPKKAMRKDAYAHEGKEKKSTSSRSGKSKRLFPCC